MGRSVQPLIHMFNLRNYLMHSDKIWSWGL